MSRDLRNDIDKYFIDRLEGYSEEPERDVWSKIDKRLTEKERKRIILSWRSIVSAAVVISITLLLPYLLSEIPFHSKPSDEKIGKEQNGRYSNRKNNYSSLPTRSENYKSEAFKINIPITTQYDLQNVIVSKSNYTVAPIVSLLKQKDLLAEPNIQLPTYPTPLNPIKKNAQLNNQTSANVEKPQISFSKKHHFTVIPFFSFDHISGRFIEQYEYDNTDVNDYSNREKPDMSFTTGLLASYKLNKNFSLTSGVSISNSTVAISSMAVKALKDASGTYKFKLATSYGFAEISKIGIMPSAGDSLLVSNAAMQFNYITLPALINYNFGRRKIQWNIHTGIALNKIISDKVQVEYAYNNNDDHETVDKIEGVKRTFFTLNTGIEAKYDITPSMAIALSPELRYGINSINKGTPVKTYPMNYGISLNLHLKL